MNALNTAPTTKNTDRPILTDAPPSLTGSRNSNTTAMITNTPRVLNWRIRYALAPSCTAPAISCIFWVPLPVARTVLTRPAAKPNATSAIAAATMMMDTLLPVRDSSLAAKAPDIFVLLYRYTAPPNCGYGGRHPESGWE
jgi:hypothetical protein